MISVWNFLAGHDLIINKGIYANLASFSILLVGNITYCVYESPLQYSNLLKYIKQLTSPQKIYNKVNNEVYCSYILHCSWV